MSTILRILAKRIFPSLLVAALSVGVIFPVTISPLPKVSLPAVGYGSLDTWHWRNPLPQGADLYDVAFLNNQFIAVGAGGVSITSTDGKSWKTGSANIADNFRSVTYGKGQYLAVGDYCVASSTDGLNWQVTPFSETLGFRGVTFGQDTFVAVAYKGIYNSSDGINWNLVCPLANEILRDIAFGNNTFVVVGEHLLATSHNGKDWDVKKHSSSLYISVCYGTSGFAVVGEDENYKWPVYLASTNGISWESKIISERGTECLYGVTEDNGVLVAIGYKAMLHKKPGQLWDYTDFSIDYRLRSVAYGNGTFVCVGDRGAIYTSSNGVTWTDQVYQRYPTLNSIIYSSNAFITVGEQGTILTSPDGKVWKMQTSPTQHNLNRVVAGNGRLVAVGMSGTIVSAEYVSTWTKQHSGTTNHLRDVAYGNGVFVAIGDSSTILTSPDGKAWTTRTPLDDYPRLIAYGNNTFLAIGRYVWTSPNGILWAKRGEVPNDDSAYWLTHGNGIFVIGSSSSIYTSISGREWTEYGNPEHVYPNVGVYEYGTFVLLGEYGKYILTNPVEKIITSLNGAKWNVMSATIGSGELNSVAGGNGAFVAVGSGGVILQSDPISTVVPRRLNAHATTVSTIRLSWQDNNINESAYKIYRKPEGGNYELVATLPANSTQYEDTGLKSGTTYCYKAAAYNSFNEAYAEVSATTYHQITSGQYLPSTPGNLQATAISSTAVKLMWQNSLFGKGFHIFRKSMGDYEQVGTVGAGVTEFLDEGSVEPNTNYYYQVQAYNDLGATFSNEAQVLTPPRLSEPGANGAPIDKGQPATEPSTKGSSADTKPPSGDTTGGTKPPAGDASTGGKQPQENPSPGIKLPTKPPVDYSTASSWAIADLDLANQANLITESIKGNFQAPITREEFCEVAVRLYEALTGMAAPTVTANPFTDTVNPTVLQACHLRIVGGKSATTFAPNMFITRQEICAMLHNALRAARPALDLTVSTWPTFADSSKVESWAYEPVRFITQHKIMGGVGGNRLDPLGNTTREQAVLLAFRTLGRWDSP